MFKSIKNLPTNIQSKIKTKIRKRAIENAKVTITIAQKDINTFSEEELEIIVADEERKIKDKLKTMSLYAILAFFGISLY